MNNLKNEIDRIGIEAVIDEGAELFKRMVLDPLDAMIDAIAETPEPPPLRHRRLWRWFTEL